MQNEVTGNIFADTVFCPEDGYCLGTKEYTKEYPYCAKCGRKVLIERDASDENGNGNN